MKPRVTPDKGGPRINANVVNSLIRGAFREGTRVGTHFVACDMARKVARTCVSGLTDAQILKIANGKAELVGVTPGPITYRETT